MKMVSRPGTSLIDSKAPIWKASICRSLTRKFVYVEWYMDNAKLMPKTPKARKIRDLRRPESDVLNLTGSSLQK